MEYTIKCSLQNKHGYYLAWLLGMTLIYVVISRDMSNRVDPSRPVQLQDTVHDLAPPGPGMSSASKHLFAAMTPSDGSVRNNEESGTYDSANSNNNLTGYANAISSSPLQLTSQSVRVSSTGTFMKQATCDDLFNRNDAALQLAKSIDNVYVRCVSFAVDYDERELRDALQAALALLLSVHGDQGLSKLPLICN